MKFAKVMFSQVSVCRQGGCLPLVLGVCLGRHPPPQANTLPGQTSPLPSACWDTHPPADTTGYGQQVNGTHPIGMHSCFTFAFFINSDKIERPVFQEENILLIAFAILLSLACSSLSIVFNNFSTAVLFDSNL